MKKEETQRFEEEEDGRERETKVGRIRIKRKFEKEKQEVGNTCLKRRRLR